LFNSHNPLVSAAIANSFSLLKTKCKNKNFFESNFDFFHLCIFCLHRMSLHLMSLRLLALHLLSLHRMSFYWSN
jgi:hypothetical protein